MPFCAWGAREDDLSYERGALKRCEKVGITVRQVVLPEDAGQQELMDNIRSLNEDERVHGVLMFRPLPKHLDDEAARRALDPRKDMDGITDGLARRGLCRHRRRLSALHRRGLRGAAQAL